MDENFNYSELTYKNKNLIRKFSHNVRFNKAIKILANYKKNNINFLDFGAGDGFFIKLLSQENFCYSLNAFDPNKEMIKQMKNLFYIEKIKNVNIFDNYNSIELKFDIITCLETLEHFNEKNQIKLLNQIKTLLKENSILIISVPLELYLPGFLKGLVRILSFQKNNTANITDLFKVLFNFEILRSQKDDYIESHVGFDHNKLIKLIKEEFNIEKKLYSPLPIFNSFLNSQMFLICKKK